MKQCILIIILFCLSFDLNAQIKIENISLIKPDTSLMYLGLENELKIIGIYNYKVSSTSSIIKNINNRILIYPKENILADTIIISKNNHIKLKKIFSICKVNEVQSLISGVQMVKTSGSCYAKYKDSISVKQLLSLPKIEFSIPEFLYNIKEFNVISFDLYIKNGVISTEITNEGSNFSTSLIEQINKLHIGDKIFFDNIRVLGPDNRIRNHGSREIIIKN